MKIPVQDRRIDGNLGKRTFRTDYQMATRRRPGRLYLGGRLFYASFDGFETMFLPEKKRCVLLI